jgi:hypothetical protein
MLGVDKHFQRQPQGLKRMLIGTNGGSAVSSARRLVLSSTSGDHTVAIDYAEKALGNREYFLNMPYSIGGGRKDHVP